MNAIAGNHKDAAMALKKAGANPSNATNYGRNALHVASMKGRWWWVVVGGGEWWLVNSVSRYKVLISYRFFVFSSVSSVSCSLVLLLLFFLQHTPGLADMVRLLLGLDKSMMKVKDKAGWTPMFCAGEYYGFTYTYSTTVQQQYNSSTTAVQRISAV
jgi:hypothetical protein